MAVDFSKYSNIDNIEESPFSSVIFGANAPVLEVELNEMQQIINSKISRLCKALAPIIIPLTDYETIDLSTTTDEKGQNWLNVSLTNDAICFTKDGLSFNIGSGGSLYILSTELDSEGKITLYANAKEVNADSETEIPWYGDEQGGNTMENTIIDSRAGIETSRRKMVTYSVKASNDSTDLSKASIILGTIIWKDTDTPPIFKKSEFWGNVPSKFNDINGILNTINETLNSVNETINKLKVGYNYISEDSSYPIKQGVTNYFCNVDIGYHGTFIARCILKKYVVDGSLYADFHIVGVYTIIEFDEDIGISLSKLGSALSLPNLSSNTSFNKLNTFCILQRGTRGPLETCLALSDGNLIFAEEPTGLSDSGFNEGQVFDTPSSKVRIDIYGIKL